MLDSLSIPRLVLYKGVNRKQQHVKYIVLDFSFQVFCYIGKQIKEKIKFWKYRTQLYNPRLVSHWKPKKERKQLCKHFRLHVKSKLARIRMMKFLLQLNRRFFDVSINGCTRVTALVFMLLKLRYNEVGLLHKVSIIVWCTWIWTIFFLSGVPM